MVLLKKSNPNVSPPMKEFSKAHHMMPPLHDDEEEQPQKKNISAAQEFRSERHKKLLEMRPSGVYPFVEGPVYFKFADLYGIHLFIDLHKEFCCGLRDNNYGRPLFFDAGIRNLQVERWTRDDVYVFSSEEDLINEFLRENLL